MDIGFEAKLLLNVLLALALGFCIGFERKLRSKEAGIRTHAIVCVGAALIMVVSKYGFGEQNADTARVAAQIVSGVGFLGAGIIMFRGQKMYGLTTAAGVWATAGVGMAAGAGMYIFATGVTVIIIIVQFVSHINKGPFRTHKSYQINISFRNTEDASMRVKKLFGVNHFSSLVMERKDDGTVYRASLNTDNLFSSQALCKIMDENDFIISIERCDDM